jgi:Tfp pilus assembly protein PilV
LHHTLKKSQQKVQNKWINRNLCRGRRRNRSSQETVAAKFATKPLFLEKQKVEMTKLIFCRWNQQNPTQLLAYICKASTCHAENENYKKVGKVRCVC